jgi:hypothetical protein
MELKTQKFVLIFLIALFLAACGGKQQTGQYIEIEPESDEILVSNKRVSDSLALVFAEKERERLAIEEKKKLGYSIGDTIPFGNLQIVVHEVEKRKVDQRGANSHLNSILGKGKPFGAMMKVSITNAGNIAKELPFTYFEEKKRRNNNPYYEEQQTPIWTASRFSYTENRKSLIKDFFIKPGKTIKIWYQITGYGGSTTLCFVEKDTAEVDERLEKMVKAKGQEFMSIVTEAYDGPLAKVSLKDALQETIEK